MAEPMTITGNGAATQSLDDQFTASEVGRLALSDEIEEPVFRIEAEQMRAAQGG